jgi:hypothetical protein
MNLTLLFATVFALSIHGTTSSPTESISKAFIKTFPSATNVSWSEEGKSYRAAFTENSVQFRVYYDKKGNITKTIRYYRQENLPVMILANINKTFVDKKVFGVTEVSSADGTVYHIILEGAEDWTMVSCTSSYNLNVDDIFKKA